MLLDNLNKYFDSARIALFEKFVPYYAASICCHIANLENIEREFFLRQGRVENLRLHMFFVAPPGFSKSLITRKFLSGQHAALSRADIDTAWEGLMTEGGYVGTIKELRGKIQVTRGAAWEHREGIMAVDEFSVLTNMRTLEYGTNLDNALLTSLDDGYLVKRLTNGKVKYTTQVTLWAASQPLRFDLSSGLGRRLWFIYFIPTMEEEELIRVASRSDYDAPVPSYIMDAIALDVENIKENVKGIESVTFDESIYEILDRIKVPHYEEALYRRFALGYTLASNDKIKKDLVITLDDSLERMFLESNEWRAKIKKGPEISQVITLLSDRGVMSVNELKDKLTDFGMNYKQATKVLRDLLAAGIIEVRKDVSSTEKTNKHYVSLTKIA